MRYQKKRSDHFSLKHNELTSNTLIFFPTTTQQAPHHPSPHALLQTSHMLTSGETLFFTFIFKCEVFEPSASKYPACALNLQCCMVLFLLCVSEKRLWLWIVGLDSIPPKQEVPSHLAHVQTFSSFVCDLEDTYTNKCRKWMCGFYLDNELTREIAL